MGPFEFMISTVAPFFRFIIFITFVTLGLTASSTFSDVLDEKYYTDGGLTRVSTIGYEFIHIINMVLSLIQIFTCFYCGMKVVHSPFPQKTEISFADKYIWDSHEAIFMLIASGINSNILSEKLLNNNLFITIYKDAPDISFMTDDRFHNIVQYSFIIVRFFLLIIGVLFVMFNIIIKGQNKLFKNRPKGIELATLIIPSVLFMTHIYYDIVHFVELHPRSLIKYYNNEPPALVKDRHLEFILENIGDLFISIIGFLLVWIYDSGSRNHLASTTLFNTIIMGLYGSLMAVKNDYSVHYLHGGETLFFVPIIFYLATVITVVIINSIKYNSIKQSIRDYIKTFYIAIGGNKSPSEILWKIGITLVITSMVTAGISSQAQWFTFEIQAGTLPNQTFNVLNTTISDIESFGNIVFSSVKEIDPCRWGHHDHAPSSAVSDDIVYDYSPISQPFNIPKTSFSRKNYDISNMNICECKNHVNGKNSCPCKYINKIKNDNVDYARAKQRDVFESSELKNVQLDYTNFYEMANNTEYLQSMKKCHTLECDVVLGVAVAAEVSIFAGDALSWIPFVGASVDTAAWFAEGGNRVGHNVIKYALKAAKWLESLAYKINSFRPLLILLKDLAELNFEVSYHFSWDVLVIYAPLIIAGFTGFLIGFFRREKSHKVFQTFENVVTFFIPLFLLNISMVFLMLYFPIIIERICSEIPKFLMVVKPKEHVGFSLLRVSYIISSIGSFILVLSSLLDDAYFMRKKTYVIREFFKYPFRKKKNINSSSNIININVNKIDIENHINIDYFQAFIISTPVIFIFCYAFANDLKFVNFKFGPKGVLLNIVSSFHSHSSMLNEVSHINDWINENSLCGIIGKAIESVIGEIINVISDATTDLIKSLGSFSESIFHFSSIISSFEKSGKKIINVTESTWGFLEKTIVLIIPSLTTLLFFILMLILPKTTEENKIEAENSIKKLIKIGIYYNLALIIMMNQLFGTISNMNLHIFYFEFDAGPLITLGIVASALNALSLLSLFVTQNL